MTLGPSFHDQTAGLSQTTTASEFGARLKDVPAVKAAPVAGRATDKHAPRGTSEYNNRESWQMTNTAIYGAHLPRSELHTRYAAPPPGEYRGVQTMHGSFVHLDHPDSRYDGKLVTSKQVEFAPEVLKGAAPARPPGTQALNTTSSVYLGEHQNRFATSSSAIGQSAKAPANPAGKPASFNPNYNIISGGPPLVNNHFATWTRGEDYRRHR